MRRVILITFVAFFALSMTAKNKAVLIGVSSYPENSGWCKLSAHNDVTLLYGLLSPKWDVTILEDSQATHRGIVSTLEKTAKTVSLGDTVLVHFSGHGQQMLPIESDPIYDPDYLDEAIVPFDAKKVWTPDYTGQNHLRDNEFGALIDAIRNKAGVNGLVIVVLDACHSDSMQRDPDEDSDTTVVCRGTSDIFGEVITNDAIKNRFKRDTSKIGIEDNATVVYLSACQANSRNAEILSPDGVGYGSLSFAIARALEEVGVKDVNAFLDRVVMSMDTMVPYQTPGIRASFDYQYPEIHEDVTSLPFVEEKERNSSETFILALATALALLLVLVVIWIKRKK